MSGSGPLLLLVPGASGTDESFRQLTSHLIAHYQVVIYDRRGFSRSKLDGSQDNAHWLATDADDVRRLIEHMTTQSALVFGSRCPAGIFSVGGRLKVRISYHLLSGTKHFGELQRLIPEASRQMLTIHSRELERMGMLQRQVYAQVPPKVEYSLTEQGWSSEPMLRQFKAWGEQMGLAF